MDNISILEMKRYYKEFIYTHTVDFCLSGLLWRKSTPNNGKSRKGWSSINTQNLSPCFINTPSSTLYLTDTKSKVFVSVRQNAPDVVLETHTFFSPNTLFPYSYFPTCQYWPALYKCLLHTVLFKNVLVKKGSPRKKCCT